jgi:hypothetical protein
MLALDIYGHEHRSLLVEVEKTICTYKGELEGGIGKGPNTSRLFFYCTIFFCFNKPQDVNNLNCKT